jgi:competence protein ComEA
MFARNTAIGVALSALIAVVTAFLVALLYDLHSAPEIVIEDAPSEVEIAVSIRGAVLRPGVYQLHQDARLIDAVDAAGGFRDDADLSQLNMAERIQDEQQIDIPATGAPVATPLSDGSPSLDGPKIDINTAGVAELDSLPGIGPVIAQRIVDYRTEHGPFLRVEELARVEGISAEMVRDLDDRISVGS